MFWQGSEGMCTPPRGKRFQKRVNHETRIHLNLETTKI